MSKRYYLPSNGDEGDRFMSEFCDNCIYEDEGNECDILTFALAGKIVEEWVYDNNIPVCIKFKPKKG